MWSSTIRSRVWRPVFVLPLGILGLHHCASLPESNVPLPSTSIPWKDPPDPEGKKALIIGAGVAGMATAYQLTKRGYNVMVVDAASSPASECSDCPAGGMQRSNVVVNRQAWWKILTNLATPITRMLESSSSLPPFQYFYIQWSSVLTDPHYWRWLVPFLKTSLVAPERSPFNRDMLQFTTWSIDCLEEFLSENPDISRACAYARRSALKLSSLATLISSENDSCLEPDVRIVVGKQALVQIEPFLASAPILEHMCSGVYQPQAASGNAGRFTQALASFCLTSFGEHLSLMYDTKVLDFEHDESTITAVLTTRGKIHVDKDTQLILATGAWTPCLGWKLGLFVPIYPLKGYVCSLTNTSKDKECHEPRGILTDGALYLSQLETELRIASIGEFAGWQVKPAEHIDKAFREAAVSRFGLDLSTSSPTKCGLRPMSADGRVILGPVDHWTNVSVNVGPGSNGWKIALGAGEVVAKILEHEPIVDFDVTSLLAHGRVQYAPWWSSLSRYRHSRSDSK